MSAVAVEAGITKPILYRHFRDKDGLTLALAERHTGRLWDLLGEALRAARTPRERVLATVDTYLSAIEEAPGLYRFLTRDVANGHVRGFTEALAAHLAVGIATELGVDVGVRERVWAAAMVGAVQTSGDRWMLHRDCPRTQLGEHLTALLWGAYGAAPRR